MYILNNNKVFKKENNVILPIEDIQEEIKQLDLTNDYVDHINDNIFIRTKPKLLFEKNITKKTFSIPLTEAFKNDILKDIFLTISINDKSMYNRYTFGKEKCNVTENSILFKNVLDKGDNVKIYASEPLKNVTVYLENENQNEIQLNYDNVKIIGKNFIEINDIKYKVNGLIEHKIVNFMRVPVSFNSIRIFKKREGIENLLNKENNFTIKFGGMVVLNSHNRISVLGKNVKFKNYKVVLPIYVKNYIVLIENNIASVIEKNNTEFKINKEEGEISFILEAVMG